MLGLNDPPDFFLKCTARSTDTLTVATSGAESSTAINEASGIKVTQVITAGVLSDLLAAAGGGGNTTTTGTYANFLTMGGTPKTGDAYKCTDGPYHFIYDGSVWQPYLLGQKSCVDPMTSVLGQTTTLGASITGSGATSLTVAAAFGSMPSTPFRICIDTEQLNVTTVSGSTWTVARGDGGTTAATHSNGATVSQMNWFWKYWISGAWYRDAGNGTHEIFSPSAGGQENGMGLFQPLPASSNYTITMAIAPTFFAMANYVSYGASIHDETNGKSNFASTMFYNGLPSIMGLWFSWGGSGYAGYGSYTTNTTPTNFNAGQSFSPKTPWFVRIIDDGTLLKFYISFDGWNFLLFSTIPRTSYTSAPSHYGMYVSGRSNLLQIQCLGFRVTTP